MMHGYWFGASWILLSALLWLGLIASIVWVGYRLGNGGGSTGRGGETAQQILDRRLAAGEIDTATYDEARSRLGGGATPKR